jgi:hypothetical protein
MSSRDGVDFPPVASNGLPDEAKLGGQAKPGGRTHQVLSALAAHPEGLTARGIAEYFGEKPTATRLSRYRSTLGHRQATGDTMKTGTAYGPQGAQNAISRITSSGRDLLARIGPPLPMLASTVIARYDAGESTPEIGRSYGVAAARVNELLKREGIRLRPRSEAIRLAAEKRADAVQLPASTVTACYAAGGSPSEIGKRYGVAAAQVRELLKREGIQLRSRAERARQARLALVNSCATSTAGTATGRAQGLSPGDERPRQGKS